MHINNLFLCIERVYKEFKGYQFTRKGLQSRSATASLLIENYQCMKEEIS